MTFRYWSTMPFGGQLFARSDWSYRDDTAKDALNFPGLTQDSYYLLDLTLTYICESGAWEISGFGRNVTDERYIVSGFANALTQGRANVTPGRPEEWGISITYRIAP